MKKLLTGSLKQPLQIGANEELMLGLPLLGSFIFDRKFYFSLKPIHIFHPYIIYYNYYW